jgi:hypothetical protein
VIAQRADAHRDQRFGDAVRGEHDAHHASEPRQAVELGGHQRDDHVVAAEADAERERRQAQRAQRRCRVEQRHGQRDQPVDAEHHELLREQVGEHAHEQPAADAAEQHEREHAGDVALRDRLVQAQEQFQVLHRAADRADRAHAADEEQRERPVGPDARPRADGGDRSRARRRVPAAGGRARRSGPGVRRGREGGRFLHDPDQGQRDGDHQDAEQLQRDVPAEAHFERVRDQRHQRAADADAEIGEAHRPPPPGVEPAREQHLVRQRPAQHVAERVAQVERVEHRQRRHRAEADRSETGEQDAGDHQPARAEAIDEPAGEKPEQRADDELRVGVARGDLGPRPAVILDHEVVEERQAVERETDDREERHERRRRCQRLAARPFEAHAGVPSLIALRRAASGCAL